MVTTDEEAAIDAEALLPELVAHLRAHRTPLRQEWAERITDAHFLSR